MLGARRGDLKSRPGPRSVAAPWRQDKNEWSCPRPLPAATGSAERLDWGWSGNVPGPRRDHLLVIGASDDPPRSRSGLRGFGDTRRAPIVKMLATQFQSTRAVSITPTTTHSISHPKSHPPSASPPPARFRVSCPSCCALTLSSSTCAQTPPKLPCAYSRYSRLSPRPTNCVPQ